MPLPKAKTRRCGRDMSNRSEAALAAGSRLLAARTTSTASPCSGTADYSHRSKGTSANRRVDAHFSVGVHVPQDERMKASVTGPTTLRGCRDWHRLGCVLCCKALIAHGERFEALPSRTTFL